MFKKNNFQSKKNIIAGRNPVVEALKNNSNIDKILLFKNASGDSVQQIRKLAAEKNIPIQAVPNEKLNSLTNVQHQGVVAFKSSVVYQDLQQVIDWVNGNGETALFLMLDGVTDVRNIGAIARSAVCYGAQAIIVPDKGVPALGEDAVKASAGALEKIQICRVSNLSKAIDLLHLNGIKIYTSEINASVKLFNLNIAEPCCIVVGSEGAGIQNYISAAADERFGIPMKTDFDSLNVSVAAGIILYEAIRQRKTE
ncbi:MAG: 23S rRNA (guanosine(2251)-2'-O)-methyltransferase RlmB [Chitinophagaceae bacterium]|jgi:23S rRNA (guanosine2251-2'-O)-methyltransferase|nr:23S rRNA (guanosine(2251)-2'-O)-methyltransferase RlmB [Chitinophagaceae bacterium]